MQEPQLGVSARGNSSRPKAKSRSQSKTGNLTATQSSFDAVAGWGGKRRGAGRPNHSGQVHHMKRPRVKASTPLHLTWKLRKDTVNLRCNDVLKVFKLATARAKGYGLRVLHFSLQSNHLHLLVECKDNEALKRGTKSLASGLGKGIRKLVGGRGRVFVGRFDLKVLVNPTTVRNAMAYVLQNYSKHGNLLNHVDRYSSAPFFTQWRLLLGRNVGPLLEDIDSTFTTGAKLNRNSIQRLPHFLSPPQSWLAREGWMRARLL